MEKKEALEFVKENIGKSDYLRLKKIKNHPDFEEAFKYILKLYFSDVLQKMEIKISSKEKSGKNLFFAKIHYEKTKYLSKMILRKIDKSFLDRFRKSVIHFMKEVENV